MEDGKSETVWNVFCISNPNLNYHAIFDFHCNGFRGIVIHWSIMTHHHFSTFLGESLFSSS